MPFLSLGFRPFFLGASLFAMAAMLVWLFAYRHGAGLALMGMTPSLWHGHAMVFGYSAAVVAGFLLTAARNWTGHPTASGAPLGLLLACWFVARVGSLLAPALLPVTAAADLLFTLGLAVAVTRPVLAVRQKRQVPVLLLLALLFGANLCFYLGAAGWLPGGERLGVAVGLYVVLGLMLFMGNRVIPFFTERGVGYKVKLPRPRWNDLATVMLFALFVPAEVMRPGTWPGALLAGGLLVLNSLRLSGWHTLGIWKKPLLWGLFAAYLMINLGFLLRALTLVTALPPNLSLHAFGVGGIGIVTTAMMARVSLAQTGRDIHRPPRLVPAILTLIVLAALIRVMAPLADPSIYALWISLAGLLWILAFGLFTLVFAPMLLRPRVASQP